MNYPNLFDQFREFKNRQPLEVARQLVKVQSALLAAEDLVRAVNSLILPAEHFLENASVRNLLDAKNNLARLLE